MRTLISGIAAAIVLGVIAAAALSSAQKPAYEIYSSSSARVSDPGSNLVGKTWSGEPKGPGDSSKSLSGESHGVATRGF